MADEHLTLMAVFAHPDDEVWMGATLAKYADLGVHTVLVTATLGEEGEIRDPDLDPDEAHERLGEIRRGELERSVEVLGISSLHILGYRDSGMAATAANSDPRNFHNADPPEAVGRLVAIIRRERPEVIVTDDQVTTRVEALPYRTRVREAMRVHRTQIAPDDPWFNLPEEFAAQIQHADTFTRARSLVVAPLPEDDLFAGCHASPT